MAVTVKRRLVNPAGRKRRKTSARRKLTLAQRLAGFGGKRSQAAAKSAKKRKRAAPKAAPKRKAAKASTPRATARKKKTAAKRNPPARIITYALENPAPSQGGKSVARKRKTTARRARRSNPARTTRRAAPRRTATRRKSNPATTRRRRANGSRSGVSNMITQSGFLLAGAVGARSATQLALGAKNVGMLGYVANIAASFVLGGLASKLLKSKPAGAAIVQGGIFGTALRAVQDLTPLGGFVNQQLGVSGIRGDVGVGFISPTSYSFFPLPDDGSGNAIPPSLPAVASAANGVAGIGRRTSRF